MNITIQSSLGEKGVVLEQLFQAFGSLNKSKVNYMEVLFQLTKCWRQNLLICWLKKTPRNSTEPQELEKKSS